jgi:hypothetical protein
MTMRFCKNSREELAMRKLKVIPMACAAALIAAVGSIATAQTDVPSGTAIATPGGATPTRGGSRGRSGGALPMSAAAEAGGGAAATAPLAAPVPMDAFAKDLLDRLNSTDPAKSAEARKQLLSIAALWQQPELLKQLNDANPDAEMKALVEQRLNDIKAKQAAAEMSNLPLLSLDINGATLTQVVAALNEAMHTPKKLMAAGGGNAVYTMEAKNVSFWEIFVALSQQQPLTMQTVNSGSGANSIQLYPSGTAIKRYVIDGPALAYINNVTFSRNVSLQTPEGREPPQSSPASLTVNYIIMIDPRVSVARLPGVTLVSAVDDAGNNLAQPGMNTSGYYGGMSSNQINQSFSLTTPENLGKSMTIVMETKIGAQATEATGKIEDLENSVNKPVTVGSRTFRVNRFQNQGGSSIQFQFDISNTVMGGYEGGMNNATRVNFTITDSNGKVVWSFGSQLAGGIGSSFQTAGSTGPYKVEIRVPDKTVDIPVRFELKNVPLP